MLRLPKLTFLRKDGTTFPGEISNAVFTNRHGQVITSMLIRDLSERKRIEHRMKTFSQELLAAREEERKLVSSVLHNDVGSMAVGISANLDAIEEDLRDGKRADALDSIKRTQTLFRESMARLKGLAVQLRPPELDLLGLCAALRQHFSGITKSGHTRICFTETLGRRRVTGETATTLFRIAQEALTNAITHGHAQQVDVRLSASNKDFILTVHDSGQGFDLSKWKLQKRSAMGLRVMREMAVFAGGAFAVDSARGKGTTVRASLPRKAVALAPGDIPAQKETGARGRTSWCAGRSAPARKRSRV